MTGADKGNGRFIIGSHGSESDDSSDSSHYGDDDDDDDNDRDDATSSPLARLHNGHFKKWEPKPPPPLLPHEHVSPRNAPRPPQTPSPETARAIEVALLSDSESSSEPGDKNNLNDTNTADTPKAE